MFPSNNRVPITTKNQSPSSCGTAVNGVRFMAEVYIEGVLILTQWC